MLIGRYLEDYATIYTLCITLISSSLGKFNFSDFNDLNFPLAKAVLLLYLLVMMFFVINMLVTMLNEFLAVLKNDRSIQPKDHEVVDYLMTQVKQFISPVTTYSPEEEGNP